jgi:platelet-activating factor acetylhydrolase IB subunit alpha
VEFDHGLSETFLALIKIWNSETGALLTFLPGHTGTVTSLLNLKKYHMASSSVDMTVKIWNYEKYTDYGAALLATLRGHSMEIRCLLLLPDENLTSGSLDKTVNIWNLTCIYNYPTRANLIASVDE